jgi:hypothetical protein
MEIDLSHETAVAFADVPRLVWLPRRGGARRLRVATGHDRSTVGARGVRQAHVLVGVRELRCTRPRCPSFRKLQRPALPAPMPTPSLGGATAPSNSSTQSESAVPERRLAGGGIPAAVAAPDA